MRCRAVDDHATAEVERVFREAYGQAVATLVRVFGDVALAEDAVQDAFVVASERWPTSGIPPNPAGWIVTTARNRAIDKLRRASRGRELHQDPGALTSSSPDSIVHDEDGPVTDDQLRLIFTCCHPALRTEHQIALTLRLLCGLSVDEVARSFLVTETTMAKRLGRAKYKITATNLPYRIPEAADLPQRVRSVLSVLYLIYNTGADDAVERGLLRAEAIRLARSLHSLMHDEPEAAGLLALLLLNESRMSARLVDGAIVRLTDQDRTRWDRALIDEGHELVRTCIRRNEPGPFQIQAAIQAVHCHARTFEATNWHQIVELYDRLMSISPTPVVALNRAIALTEIAGPVVGLAAIDATAEALDNYRLMHAARADLLRRLGRTNAARIAYERAAALATTATDRQFLAGQIEALEQ